MWERCQWWDEEEEGKTQYRTAFAERDCLFKAYGLFHFPVEDLEKLLSVTQVT